MNKTVHTILMVKKADPSVHQVFQNVVGYEGRYGCLTVLKLDNGFEATFDKEQWEMYDLTPTKGWNDSAIELSEDPSCADVKAVLAAAGWFALGNGIPCVSVGNTNSARVIAITLNRSRPSEGESWADDLALTIPADKYNAYPPSRWSDSKFVKMVVMGMVSDFLTTPAGLAENKRVVMDFNWGDLVDSNLPLVINGMTLGELPKNVPITCSMHINVDQDENLAPANVEAEVVDKAGNYLGEAEVNFDSAEAIFLSRPKCDDGTELFVKLGNGCIYSLKPSDKYDGVFVIENLPDADLTRECESPVQIAVHLVRENKRTMQLWDDTIYVLVPAGAYRAAGEDYWKNPDFIHGQLAAAASAWLQTPAGLNAIVESDYDFNWNNFVLELPMTANGITIDEERDESLPVSFVVSVQVNKDEELAPDAVFTDVVDAGGKKLGNAVVNFRYGVIDAFHWDEGIPDNIDQLTLVGLYANFAIQKGDYGAEDHGRAWQVVNIKGGK